MDRLVAVLFAGGQLRLCARVMEGHVHLVAGSVVAVFAHVCGGTAVPHAEEAVLRLRLLQHCGVGSGPPAQGRMQLQLVVHAG